MATVDSSLQVTTLQEARELGLTKYFPGTPCRHGHVAERFTSSRGCVVCAALRGKSEKRKQYLSSYKEKNYERLCAEKRAHYWENIERTRAQQLAYRERNRQKIRDHGREFRRANPELAKAISLNAHHKRRSQMKGGMTGKEFRDWKKAAPKICYWCGCKCHTKFVVDHYEPLARGGKHERSNLVIACPSCNSTKRSKDPLEFAASVGRLF